MKLAGLSTPVPFQRESIAFAGDYTYDQKIRSVSNLAAHRE